MIATNTEVKQNFVPPIQTKVEVKKPKRVIGFSGSHCIGKSLIATRVASDLGIKFIDTKIKQSSAWSWNELNPTDLMSFGERIYVQEVLLHELEQILKSLSEEDCVINRTPIDILAYLLVNIDKTASVVFNRSVKKFVDKCIKLCSVFTHFVIIKHGLPIALSNNTNRVHQSYVLQEALTNVIIGSYYRYLSQIGSDKLLIEVPESIVDQTERVIFIRNVLNIF